jgi:hypothetical protein
MKKLPVFKLLLLSIFAIHLFSCGDEANSGTTNDNISSAMDTVSNSATVSNIVTDTENIVVVRYKVSDYAKWMDTYDSRDSMRNANGLHNYAIGRGVMDMNEIMVAVKADDMEKAKEFSKGSELQSALKKGFVSGKADYIFTKVVYQDMSPNMPDLRAMTFFKVKDWNAWKASFESSRQVRIDNGLIDRAYGFEDDDSTSVILVVAVKDSTKAEAFWNSDLIKQRRKESGVTGDVERFVYRVVKKY